MRLKACLAALSVCAVVVVPAGAVPTGRTRAPVFNVIGKDIRLVFENKSDQAMEIPAEWRVYPYGANTDTPVARYFWTKDQLLVRPGGSRVWEWNQREGCFGACSDPFVGEQVAAGPYRALIGNGGGDSIARFHVGQFFRVGFDHLSEDELFTVFVNRDNDIAAMTAEADAQEKTQMVTGIVRDARRYNSSWNFTMGPGSIILAEVSIEVCDADPYYVQDHKRQWMGDRWCPWSSYVAAVGR